MNFEIYRILNLDYVGINIIDLKTNTRVKFTDCEQFKNINIGHRMFVNYKDKSGINRCINGTICSVEHELDQDNESINYRLIIKVY